MEVKLDSQAKELTIAKSDRKCQVSDLHYILLKVVSLQSISLTRISLRFWLLFGNL